MPGEDNRVWAGLQRVAAVSVAGKGSSVWHNSILSARPAAYDSPVRGGSAWLGDREGGRGGDDGQRLQVAGRGHALVRLRVQLRGPPGHLLRLPPSPLGDGAEYP